MSLHNARSIANWFMAWAGDVEEADISNLKIQKLLYYAQGEHYAETGQPLFSDDFQAWAHGPVVPSVYRDLKKWQGSPIDVDEALPDDYDCSDYRDVEEELLKVWNTIGIYSAWSLRNITNNSAPLRDGFRHDNRNAGNSKGAIKSFLTRGVRSFARRNRWAAPPKNRGEKTVNVPN